MGSLRNLRSKSKSKSKNEEKPAGGQFVTFHDPLSNYFSNLAAANTTYTVSVDLNSLMIDIEIEGTHYNVSIEQLKEIAKKAAEANLVDLNNL